jgi:radical SAM superfamily enzyme with C-terminal helix-hairpin-helix motif
MNTIDYFKLQAKNLHKDFKTKTPVFDKTINDFLCEYKPKYFEIDMIISDFDIDEKNFSLMNAQHVIAKIANFDKWATLLKATPAELELAKLLYDHQDKIDLIGWKFYIADAQSMNETELDAEIQVEIFKQVVVEENIFDLVIESYLLKHYY